MRIVITGGTGFIGRRLVVALLAAGHAVAVPSRDPDKPRALFGDSVATVAWDGRDPAPLATLLDDEDSAVVNLAGEPIAAGRWTAERKRRILDSRVDAGRAVAEAARSAAAPPRVVVQGSAVGYYGPDASADGHVLHEDRPRGDGFLAEVCEAWEASSAPVEELGVRRVVVRTGLVLGEGGGILQKFLPPFRAFVGGPLGSGHQWLPWVHMDDQVGAIATLLADETAAGVYNICAPGAVSMAEFCRALGRVLNRPSWLPVPAVALKLLLGAEMAGETVLASQRAAPTRLSDQGYAFTHTDIDEALARCLAAG